jgi:hypothetical protein
MAGTILFLDGNIFRADQGLSVHPQKNLRDGGHILLAIGHDPA